MSVIITLYSFFVNHFCIIIRVVHTLKYEKYTVKIFDRRKFMRKSRFLKFALLLVLTLSLTVISAVVSTANDEEGVDMMAAILADEALNQYKQGDTIKIADDGYIGIPVELTIYYDASKPTKSGNDVDATNLILYIVNADFERIGTDSDVDIIKSMIDRGYIVTVLDYKNHKKAKSPDLDFSIQLLRDKIYKGNYFTDRSVFMEGAYPNSFVVPSGYDVSPHHVFWEIDKHGTDGTFDKIIEYWNNDFRAWNNNKDLVIPWVDENGNRKATQTAHDGTEPVRLSAHCWFVPKRPNPKTPAGCKKINTPEKAPGCFCFLSFPWKILENS